MLGWRGLSERQYPQQLRMLLVAELHALKSELNDVGWGQIGPLLHTSGENVRKASKGAGGPQVMDGLLRYRGITLEQLLDKHGAMATGVVRAMMTEGRYASRDEAIRTHVRYAEHPEDVVRQAADAVATSLDSDEDPGERWWYEQIDAELKRSRKGRPRLGERPATDDDD